MYQFAYDDIQTDSVAEARDRYDIVIDTVSARPPVDPRDPGDPRASLIRSGEETGELHGTDGDKRTRDIRFATPGNSPGRGSAFRLE